MNKIILKTIILILIITTVTLSIPRTTYAVETTIKVGDINGDGIIDSRDTLRILEHIAASTIPKIKQKHSDWILKNDKLKAADINGDGVIDSRDTLRILEYIASSTIPKIAQKHPTWKTYLESKWKVAVTGITLDKTSLTILKGKNVKLTATVLPKNATNKIVTWSSSDINVATVDGIGNVKAKSEGIAVITATSSNGKKIQCKVEVKKSVIAVTSIALNKTALTLTKGNTAKLVATIKPSNATNNKVTWSSSNSNIVAVSNGKITAKKEGTATITVMSSNGKVAKCKVVVKNPTILVKSVSLNKSSLTLNKGATANLVAIIKPTNANNKSVTWKSSNSNIVAVSNGKITAKKAGTATITVTSSNGKKASCKITVKPIAVSSITLKQKDRTIAVGTSLQLNATVLPANADNKTIIWSSSNSKIAKVSNSGIVTGVNAGKVTITAKTSNNKVAKCTIRVNIPAKSISLNKKTMTINKGSSEKLIVSFNPTNTSSKAITWKSSNTNIATVDINGVVKAISKGTTTITATSTYGKIATCTVTVNDKVYYVSKNGSDSNSGTSLNNAFKTIKKGISKLSAGYTLMVSAGTYSEGQINLSKSGTSTNPIKIVANGDVRIAGSGKRILLHIKNVNNVIIDGFTFQNLSADDAKGILIEPNTENIVIRNCKFNNIKTKHPNNSDVGASAIFLHGSSSKAINNIKIENCTLNNISAGWSEAISVDGNCTNITITGVKVTYNGLKGNIGICICGNYGTCSNKSLDRPRHVTISNCNVSNCKSPYDPGSAYGIYVDGGEDVKIFNNIVTNCEGGIEVGAEKHNSKLSGRETENIKVYNNTIKNCGIGVQIGGWDGKACVKNVWFDSNTLLDCGKGDGKAIEFSRCKDVTISNCKFNTSQGHSYENSSMAKNITKKNNTYK